MRRLALVTIVAVSVVAIFSWAAATSVLERSVAELFQRADQVIYGVVESRSSQSPVDADAPALAAAGASAGATIVTILVERLYPADDASVPGTIELRFGATPDARGQVSVVDDLPIPDEGDRILVARYAGDELISPVVGFWQGSWTVGPEGLVDLRGRVLGLDGDVVRLGGSDRDATRVVAAVFRALRGEGGRFGEQLEPTDPDETEATVPPEPLAEPAEPAEQSEPSEPPEPPVATVVRLSLAGGAQFDASVEGALHSAAQAWTAVGVPLDIELEAGAADRLIPGARAEMGPDALAITRRLHDGGGVEVLLHPDPDGLRVDVLTQVLGRLLGLPAGPSVVRSGLIPSDRGMRPSVEDGGLLLELLTRTPGDLDANGVVDLYDLALLAEAYDTPGTRHPADLDDSGIVDAGDLELLRAAYRFLPAAREPPPGRRSSGADEVNGP